MPQSIEDKTHGLLVNTTFVGTASTDYTTNLMRRLAQLTGEMTARMKSIFLAAGAGGN